MHGTRKALLAAAALGWPGRRPARRGRSSRAGRRGRPASSARPRPAARRGPRPAAAPRAAPRRTLNGVEPQAWLTDVLERVVSGRTKAHELEGYCRGMEGRAARSRRLCLKRGHGRTMLAVLSMRRSGLVDEP
jgi:hypothetical protein